VSKIFLPSTGSSDWKRLLAEPDKHWRTGYSAKTLAQCWEASNGLPPEIAALFPVTGDTDGLLLAIPEYKVALPGSNLGASQNDVFALIRVNNVIYSVMVEGKVSEPFGNTVADWLIDASDGKKKRLDFVCSVLGLAQPVPSDVY
jgi:hypothetical protein